MPKINIHSINFNRSLLNTEFLDTTKKFTSHELTKHEKLLLLLKANSKLIKHIKSKQKIPFDESILVFGSSYQDHNSNCMCYENTGYSSFHLLPGTPSLLD